MGIPPAQIEPIPIPGMDVEIIDFHGGTNVTVRQTIHGSSPVKTNLSYDFADCRWETTVTAVDRAEVPDWACWIDRIQHWLIDNYPCGPPLVEA